MSENCVCFEVKEMLLAGNKCETELKAKEL